MPMIKSPHGEGGCVCALPATDWTPHPLLPLLNRFDFRSTRPQTLLRRGGSNYGY
ncbi:TPA: hypothetical protein RHY07_000649 [Escherichia coli]|uniref:YmjE family protein n=1 Tax=Escherichia coli TaxID=562 RepID=UPI0011E99C0C|nr:hypothetical protein [Escherichia coli]EES0671022.1 hypothetical protein [Escherichia coli]EEU3601674.1 hypothetical protein [Escherichia coli]EEZ2195766.1 hypothetical protein [Escherichia coli]EFC2500143.1 hypothetical protein [Escherichia coli]EFS2095336.1 hypothetical protein [Escherichia coli]